MQMQKMEGISYGHPGFIFAQNNLPHDGKPFGNCNYRRVYTTKKESLR
ncbi:hypothetical protein OROMI_030913 [Orobanche minor]